MSQMDKKKTYVSALQSYCEEYKKILLVGVDNVGSSQMQKVRKALRGKAVIVMGRNTIMRKALKLYIEKNKKIEPVLGLMKGNVGFVFTNSDLTEVKNIISGNKVDAPARQGAISPVKVVIPAGNTGMEPTKTSFFQALSIPTKINKGTVEIISDYTLLQPGQKVGSSEAALLQMMNIKPFKYGLTIKKVYDDGSIFEPEILDITDDIIAQKFQNGINSMAALSLQIGIPTEASVTHSMINSFKSLLQVAAVTEISFTQAEEIKSYLKDPSKFAVATTTTSAPAEEKKDSKKKEEEKKEEEKPAEDEDMGFGALF